MANDVWLNCYDDSWKGVICDPSMSHPAKFSHGLIRRIYQYLIDEGLVQPGDTVVDPFGGVALGALYAMKASLNWVGCELEGRFCGLGQQNIDLWNSRYAGHFPNWGQAVLLQGDSRHLCEVISAAGCVVSSPPYASGENGHPSLGSVNKDDWGQDGRGIASRRGVNGSYGDTPGNIANLPGGEVGAVISSPPYADSVNQSAGANDTEARIRRMAAAGIDTTNRANVGGKNGVARQAQSYGDSPGQLGSLKEGDISAVVSSPPFAGNTGGRGEASRNGIDAALFDRHSGGMIGGMGETEGNLGNLRTGEAGAVVGSPPFEGSDLRKGGSSLLEKNALRRGRNPYLPGTVSNIGANPYGETPGQIGNDQGETFWEAARLIVLQCAALLAPGRPAVFVTKRFVKNGQIVDFTAQWIQLCESCGFRLVHHHKAMLVKNRGIGQAGIDGEITSKETARLSFFRRLHQKKYPHLAIEWEDVTCFIRL